MSLFTDIKCHTPSDINYASISPELKRYDINSTVTYTCQPGFVFPSMLKNQTVSCDLSDDEATTANWTVLGTMDMCQGL